MSGPSKILGETQRVWICVLKMSDLTGPRRRADRPRVVVKALPKRPGLELDRWVKTSRRANRMRVVNVVYEAMPRPSQHGGRDCPFIKPSQKPEATTTTAPEGQSCTAPLQPIQVPPTSKLGRIYCDRTSSVSMGDISGG